MDESIKKVMVRYPRLTAHLICGSLGYFTPKGAAQAIYAYKNGVPYTCEYLTHVAGGYDKNAVKRANKFVIKEAIEKRNLHSGYMNDYQTAKVLVEEVIQSGQKNGALASWF